MLKKAVRRDQCWYLTFLVNFLRCPCSSLAYKGGSNHYQKMSVDHSDTPKKGLIEITPSAHSNPKKDRCVISHCFSRIFFCFGCLISIHPLQHLVRSPEGTQAGPKNLGIAVDFEDFSIKRGDFMGYENESGYEGIWIEFGSVRHTSGCFFLV